MPRNKTEAAADLLGWTVAYSTSTEPALNVEGPLPGDETWRMAATFLRRGQQLVLAEVRVFPGGDRLHAIAALPITRTRDPRDASPDLAPGQWSHRLIGLTGVTHGGVTTRRLRAVPVEALKRAALRWLHEHKHLGPDWGDWNADRSLGMAWGSVIDNEAVERPGRAGRPDGFYAAWAARYLELLADGESRPIHVLAARHGKTSAHVRDRLNQARVRGLLTSPRPGIAGGELTMKGRQALIELENRS